MTDVNGFKYEFEGVKYRTNEEVDAALAAHLGMESLPSKGKHGGEIVIMRDGAYTRVFTYVHEDGVDKIVPA